MIGRCATLGGTQIILALLPTREVPCVCPGGLLGTDCETWRSGGLADRMVLTLTCVCVYVLRICVVSVCLSVCAWPRGYGLSLSLGRVQRRRRPLTKRGSGGSRHQSGCVMMTRLAPPSRSQYHCHPHQHRHRSQHRYRPQHRSHGPLPPLLGQRMACGGTMVCARCCSPFPPQIVTLMQWVARMH